MPEGLQPKRLTELAPDGDSQDVFVYVGYAGRSQRAQHWRLYLNPELNDYIELHSDDVVFARLLERTIYPLGGTVVWVRREANVVRTRAVPRDAERDFLAGDVARAWLARSAESAAFRSGLPWLLAGGCLTGGDLDTYCSACSAVPTALVLRTGILAQLEGPSIQRSTTCARRRGG